MSTEGGVSDGDDHSPALEGQWVTIRGGRLWVAHGGRGEALVLLHGWTLDSRVWAPQLLLRRRYHLIVPDRRGFGRSSAPADVLQESNDLAVLLDACGVERAVVVGQSQAGRVALRFANDCAGRVLGLVLQGASRVGAVPSPQPEEAIPLAQYSEWIRSGQIERMKRDWSRHPLMLTRRPEAAAAVEAMLRDYTGRDLEAEQALVDSPEPSVGTIQAPALVITGVQDTPWRQRVGDALAQELPRGQRLVIENSGHLCNLCSPDAFNAALSHFMDTTVASFSR